MPQVMISDRFSYRYRIIAFYGALNCLDYYESLNLGITIAVGRKAKSIVCSIADQGIGIPEEKINAVFERFYRVDTSRNSSTGGSGLGLSIVKKLADLKKIKVTLKSEKNIGTTFVLTIPA